MNGCLSVDDAVEPLHDHSVIQSEQCPLLVMGQALD